MNNNYYNVPALSASRDLRVNNVGEDIVLQNVPDAAAAMQALCQKTENELVNAISNVQVQNHNCLPGGIMPCSNMGYFPVCREYVRSLFDLPLTLQDVLAHLQWDRSFDDDAWIKAVLVMNLVEAHLMIMAQNPRERARFLPVDFATEAARQLCNTSKYRQLTLEEFLFLKILIAMPEMQGRLTYDEQLFNTDIVSHEILVHYQNGQGTASELTLYISVMLGLATEHYPFLRFAALSDMMNADSISMLQKAYSLAAQLGINAADPFREFLRMEQFPYNQKYVLSTANFLLPPNLLRVDIRGEQHGIKQTLIPFTTPSGTNFLPMTLVSSTTCPCPKLMFLPVRSVPLFGLERLYYSGNPHTLLTPSLATAVVNQYLQDGTLMSWWGNVNTIDLVDWTPLTGRPVYYLVHPWDFGGKFHKTIACLNAVREKLISIGCAFHIIDLSQPPQLQENPYV